MQVKNSQYNITSLRDTLIQPAAMAAQHSTSGKNCHDQEYDIPLKKKRWWHSLPLVCRHMVQPRIEHSTFCNYIDFAGAHYYSPYVNVNNVGTATDYIEAEWRFEKGEAAELSCDFISGLIDGLTVVAPEFAVEDVGLGSAIDVICKGDK